jgi:hypothetical protein
MSDERHLDPESLEEISALPASDPRRRHVEGCARCRAMLEAYRIFLEAPPPLPELDAADVRARMTAARASEATGHIPTVRRAVGRRRARVTWSDWRLAGAAAALVVVAGLLYATRDLRQKSEVNLRGVERRRQPAPEILESSRDSNGTLTIRWRAVPAATNYRVMLFGAGLDLLGQVEAGSRTELVLAPPQLPPGSHGPVYGQVVALRDGQEIATSSLAPVGSR